ncbi:MAG: haloacid dehalogenase [Candidatus Bathyarchaeota archaeon]
MIEELVKRGAEELRIREAALDIVMENARKARIQSKQAILRLHNDDIEGARERLEKAQGLLDELEITVEKHPELGCFNQVSAAKEEFSEAYILLEIQTGSNLPEPKDLGVPITSYLLGLGDVPGELRRQALDALRRGDLETAVGRLGIMEEIYLGLVMMEEAPLLKGLRRKMDIARGVIERTRSEITAEAGRRRLGEKVERLTDKLDDSR